ncbi:MAG TPA: hypothetical protein VGK67_10545 [Myxococcales bacterium]
MQPRVLLLSVAMGLGLACGAVIGPNAGDPDGGEWGDPDATVLSPFPDGGFQDLEDAGWTVPGDSDAGTSHGCPPCAADEECDYDESVCVKKGRCVDGGTQDVTCASAGVQCGSFSYLDKCDGQFRTLQCPACQGDQACVSGQCRCQAESDAVLCEAAGALCGVVTVVDGCGDLRSARCGTCGFGEVCLPGTRACEALTACGAGTPCPAEAPYCRDDGYCVQCTGSGACASGSVCDPELNLCLQCLQDADCPANARRCLEGVGTCVECLVGPDCDSGRCSPGDHQCQAAPPPNDGCAGAEAVQVGLGVSGELADAASDATPSCGAQGIPDVAFALRVPVAGPYTIVVTPLDPELAPTVSVRTRCELPETEVGCAATAPGQPVRLQARLPVGEVVLWVGGVAGAGRGAFTLEVLEGPTAAAPGNDTCAGAEPLALVQVEGSHWQATAKGSTVLAGDGYAGSCAYSDGPDVVYALHLDADAKVTATVTSDRSVLAYQPTAYLRGPGTPAACADYSAEKACSFEAGGGSATAVAGALAGNADYYLVVDGAYGSAGGFDLVVDVDTPLPMADGCDGYSFAPPDPGQTRSFDADTSAATNQAEGACGGSGPDALYTFTLGAPTAVTIRLTATGADAPLRPLFYLRRGACGSVLPSDEYACAVPGPEDEHVATRSFPSLPAGTWWLWVDGFAGSRGPYTLAVSQP